MTSAPARVRPLPARPVPLGRLDGAPRGADRCRAWTRWARGRSSRSARSPATSRACSRTGRASAGARVVGDRPRARARRSSRSPRSGRRSSSIRRTSLDALAELPPADAVVLDGDHNHFTVSERARGDRGARGRRDAPARAVPRRRLAARPPRRLLRRRADPAEPPAARGRRGQGLVPGDAGVRRDGLPYPRSAAREGGARNGVLTAAEDFVAGRDDLRLVVVPGFFGFGALWDRRAPLGGRRRGDPRSVGSPPAAQRLEDNRLHQLATAHARYVEIVELRERLARQEAVLRRQLESSAFSRRAAGSRACASAPGSPTPSRRSRRTRSGARSATSRRGAARTAARGGG